MKNEKGLTLIELLAAITITSILLGAASMLFVSVFHVSNTSSQHYSDNSSMNFTMNTVSRLLSESSQAVYYSGNNEFRCKQGSNYSSIYFDNVNHKVTIYQFNAGDASAAHSDAQFRSGSISVANNPNMYTNPQALASNISNITYKLSNGQDVSSIPLTNGEVIKASIAFNNTFITVNGTNASNPTTKSIGVKLLLDTTRN